MRFAAALVLAGCLIAAAAPPRQSGRSRLPIRSRRCGALQARTSRSCPEARTSRLVPATFLVVDGQGRLVTRPTARVWLARQLKAQPFARTTARSEPIGVGRSSPARCRRSSLPTSRSTSPASTGPGRARRRQEDPGTGNLVVRKKTAAPDVGDPVPASKTPTLATASLTQLTTATKPDPELYRARSRRTCTTSGPSSSCSRRPSTARAARAVPSWTSARRAASASPRPGSTSTDVEMLQGQRPREGREPLGAGVEASLGALDLPRRRGRAGARAIRGHGLRCRSSTRPSAACSARL